MTSIATKTGDQGETALFNGRRVSKADPRMDVLGTLDELTAHLGFLELDWVQSDLLNLGALIAQPEKAGNFDGPLARLEQELEKIEASLPTLQNFILPSGTQQALQAHVARAVCRRAERELCRLEAPPAGSLPYLNRLSDYLFQWARAHNQAQNREEKIWRP